MKNDGEPVDYVGRKILEDRQHRGAILSEKNASSIIVEMANVNGEDGIEKWQ